MKGRPAKQWQQEARSGRKGGQEARSERKEGQGKQKEKQRRSKRRQRSGRRQFGDKDDTSDEEEAAPEESLIEVHVHGQGGAFVIDISQKVSGWGEYCQASVGFLLLPVAPGVSFSSTDNLRTLRDINFRLLPLSPAVSYCLPMSTTRLSFLPNPHQKCTLRDLKEQLYVRSGVTADEQDLTFQGETNILADDGYVGGGGWRAWAE